MKKNFTAFPAAKKAAKEISGSCSTASCTGKRSLSGSHQQHMAPSKASDLVRLCSFLPESHTYSLDLAESLCSLVSCDETKSVSLSSGNGISITRACSISPGLLDIELGIKSSIGVDGEHTNYGFSSWVIRIGGQGPGAEEVTCGLVDSDQSFLFEKGTAPVSVRFAVPIAHVLVDDIGFLDNDVWKLIPSKQPSLLEIINMVGSVLLEPQHEKLHQNDPRSQEEFKQRWISAQRHSYNKYLLIQSFSAISDHRAFLDPIGGFGISVSCEGWVQPSLIAMVNSVKEALFEAAGLKTNKDEVSLSALIRRNCAQTRVVLRAWRDHITEHIVGIYSFDMFTRLFCDSFVHELALYEASALPRRRPNTMNNYGLILNDIGMHGLMTALMEKFLVPLVEVLYSEEPVAYGIDHHHSFIVQYQNNTLDKLPSSSPAATAASSVRVVRGDKGLDMHSDSSEVTVNVCLGKEGFRGGGLRFCGLAGSADYRRLQYTLQHVIGRAVVHLGRHRHGADDLLPSSPQIPTDFCPSTSTSTNTNVSTDHAIGSIVAVTTDDPSTTHTLTASNERINLIMWLRSSQFRAAAAYGHIAPDGFPKIPEDENTLPDKCCLSKFNDPDYELQLQRINKKN
mmetsp:Transcript_7914/g.16053  ORF Transcript_7914/g.16053 Transcript_7914/m.16053 type:complete len:624 (+) Transcript_7914:40-1911(+)